MKSAKETTAAVRPTTGPLRPTTRILGCVEKACVMLRLKAAKDWSQCLCRSGPDVGAFCAMETFAPLGAKLDT